MLLVFHNKFSPTGEKKKTKPLGARFKLSGFHCTHPANWSKKNAPSPPHVFRLFIYPRPNSRAAKPIHNSWPAGGARVPRGRERPDLSRRNWEKIWAVRELFNFRCQTDSAESATQLASRICEINLRKNNDGEGGF